MVELLIATSIIFLVAGAIYSAFANGVGVWRRCNINRKLERDVMINLTKMTRSIRNTFEFTGIAFEGTREAVSFPALVNEGEVGRLSYFFDDDKKKLYKNEKTYIELYGEDPEAEIESFGGEVLISDVEDWEFSYCYLDNITSEYKWKEIWQEGDQDTIPQAVRIDFSFKKDEDETLDFTKTVYIPIGTGEQKIELSASTEEI